jgi:hypothetical protein
MARVTHVKAAQQRYKTVPVIDPATGVQKITPVLRKNGSPKTTKKGKEIVRRITIDDKTQPLPNHKCEKCGKEIEVGQPYKWIAPKSGPYGGRKLIRCDACPTWNVWDYSSSLGARISQLQAGFEESFNVEDITAADEVTDQLSSLAEEIRELAQEKEEGADNIENGFGHATSQSDELREVADGLNGWADEVEQAEIPAEPEPEEDQCDECGGEGHIEETAEGPNGILHSEVKCEQCEGSGQYTSEEPTEDQYNEWRTDVEEAVSSVVDNCPV